ncbi:MAG: GFA family protein [Gammaproteobacteria bacterium]
MPDSDSEMTGGCLCGAVRYRATGPVRDSAWCHCRTCQRAHSAPAVAWFTVPDASLAYTLGKPTAYASSSTGQREFCAACGSQLVFRDRRYPGQADVATASLDHPGTIAPGYHIWRMSRVPWFETADALPRHDDAGPDAPAAD